MFSLSYLPTAERLKVVVVKARNLKLSENAQNNSLQSVFVKVRNIFFPFSFALSLSLPFQKNINIVWTCKC